MPGRRRWVRCGWVVAVGARCVIGYGSVARGRVAGVRTAGREPGGAVIVQVVGRVFRRAGTSPNGGRSFPGGGRCDGVGGFIDPGRRF